jgi:hypothetical protein
MNNRDLKEYYQRVCDFVKDHQREFSDLNEGNIYSMRGGVEIQAHVESRYGEVMPKERPHYE